MRFLSKIIISQNLPPHYKEEATHFGSLAQQIPLNGKRDLSWGLACSTPQYDRTSYTPVPHKLHLILLGPILLRIFESNNPIWETSKSNSQSLKLFIKQTTQCFSLPQYCIPSMKPLKCPGQLPNSKRVDLHTTYQLLCQNRTHSLFPTSKCINSSYPTMKLFP